MSESKNRPSWDEYFIEVMHVVAGRATCDRGRSGCVIARDNVLLSSGYVGAPKGSPHCDDVGHLMKEVKNEDGTTSRHCMRTAHAEANAICQAAKNGISINGATLYCKMVPCRNCAMMIANSGIVRVVAEMNYHGSSADESKQILKNAGVKLDVLTDKDPSYGNR
jgi:dCMP deaminase